MQNFLTFLSDLFIYFMDSFISLDSWVISFPFFLAVTALPVYLLTAVFFHKGKVVA